MNLTPPETKALKALQIESGCNGHDFGVMEMVEWTGSRKQLGGLVTSLQEKGVITCVDRVCVNDREWLTQYVLADEFKN